MFSYEVYFHSIIISIYYIIFLILNSLKLNETTNVLMT